MSDEMCSECASGWHDFCESPGTCPCDYCDDKFEEVE